MIPRLLRRLAPLAMLLALPACRSTTSTEVGVRTNLLGVTEQRGEQEIYAPGGI